MYHAITLVSPSGTVLDFGLSVDLSLGPSSPFVPFPVLDPPRHSVGCAAEVMFDTRDKIITNVVLWVAGRVVGTRGT